MNDFILSAGDRLHVRFLRRGDRWHHTIQLRSGGQLIGQLDSDDEPGDAAAAVHSTAPATADALWPRSPTFQNLEIHTAPNGRQFVLLVGMAGASHWSASVEADAIAERIAFDVACRIKSEPRWLGSSYLVAPSASGDNMVIDVPGGDAASPSGASLQSGKTAIAETVGRRRCVRVVELTGPLPRTVRWKYSISATGLV